MRKRGKVLIALLCVSVAVVVTAYLSRDNEPRYEGRSLSAWFGLWAKLVESDDPNDRAKAEEAARAIRQIGTNALPVLLKRLHYEPAGSPSKLARIVEKLPSPLWDNPVVDLLFSERGAGRANDATAIFVILGPKASPAVPELTSMMCATNKPEMVLNVTYCLAAIGKGGLPSIMTALSDARLPCCRDVAYWLGAGGPFTFGTNISAVVPLLARSAVDADPDLSAAAIKALGRIALEPETALPAITNGLLSGSFGARREAAHALWRFGDRARPFAPALVVALNDPDYGVRSVATNALRQIAPELLANGPGS